MFKRLKERFANRIVSARKGLFDTASIENLVVEAWENKSKQMVYQAVSLDPLCSAVLSLEEIKSMCDELFEVNREYLGDYR